MAKKKLTKVEIKEISIRDSLLKAKRVELRLLENERAMYMMQLLESKGLDATKEYSVNKDGVITKQKDI